jgi:hypothetical protein
MTNSNEDLDPHIADLVAENMADLIWKEDEPVNNTEPVPTIYEVLLDCYHAGSMSQRGKTIHPGTVEEWQKQIERICASERLKTLKHCREVILTDQTAIEAIDEYIAQEQASLRNE